METKSETKSSPYTIQILLADDDKDDCYFFELVLGKMGFNTNLTIVNNGEALMQLLNSKDYVLPHFIFLDINMPKKNGIECLKEIKGNAKFSDLSVIILSSHISGTLADELRREGAKCCLQKPDDINKYKIIISGVLQGSTEYFDTGLSQEKP